MAAPVDAMTITDFGDVVVEGDCLEEGQRSLAEHIAKALRQTDRVVVFGGGHETAFASFQGLRSHRPEAQIGIINLDAHLDLRLVGENGPSSGTPFTQIRDLATDRFDYLCLGVAEESNTQALFNRAKEWSVGIVKDYELVASRSAADAAIEAIVERSDLIYLTIDLDLLPAYRAPGVSAPAPRGVPLHTVERLINQVLSTCNKHSCPIPLADIVELSPAHDHQGATARTAALLAQRLLCF
jgi:formiminoglutamase